MPYRYYSSLLLKPIRCHLVSYFNTGPSICPTLMQPGRQKINTFPYDVKRKSGIKYLEFIFKLISCSWFWPVDFFRALRFDQQTSSMTQLHKNKQYGLPLRLRGGHSVGLLRPNHRSKIWLSSRIGKQRIRFPVALHSKFINIILMCTEVFP
jgi:hypothetical protein